MLALAMATKKKAPVVHAFAPDDEDRKILADLQAKFLRMQGRTPVNTILRMGLRLLAEKEGLRAS